MQHVNIAPMTMPRRNKNAHVSNISLSLGSAIALVVSHDYANYEQEQEKTDCLDVPHDRLLQADEVPVSLRDRKTIVSNPKGVD